MADKKLDPQASIGQPGEEKDLAPHGDVSRKSFIGRFIQEHLIMQP